MGRASAMLNPLLLCLVSSVTAALNASALDSSSAALTSLVGVGSLVEIGASGGGNDGHGHSHGGESGSGDVHRPSAPHVYVASVPRCPPLHVATHVPPPPNVVGPEQLYDPLGSW